MNQRNDVKAADQLEKESRFRIDPLEERIAPTIVAVNGGGNTPNGEANGVPRLNPAGFAPLGHN